MLIHYLTLQLSISLDVSLDSNVAAAFVFRQLLPLVNWVVTPLEDVRKESFDMKYNWNCQFLYRGFPVKGLVT